MPNEVTTTKLSSREKEIVQLAAQGLTDKEIGNRLGAQLSTIRTYWERIRLKLGALNKPHAVVLGLQQLDVEKIAEEVNAFILRRIADEAIFVVDRDEVLKSWNEGVEYVFGYSEQEWIGRDCAMFFLPDEKQDAPKELHEADEKGASSYDRWHVRKDGTKFWGSDTVIAFDEPTATGAYAKIVRVKDPPDNSQKA